MTFESLKLDEKILEAISYMGFKEATPIQEQTIPAILNNQDLIACAQTGTGKTAAFMLPILHKIVSGKNKGTSVLVIVPTRELALQIDQQIQGFAYFIPVSSMAIYGGGSGNEWETQKNALAKSDIIIATPGKLISHINMGNVRFDNLKHLILDEADRMLDMGFYDDIQKIIKALPKTRQTLMFSATMPPKMRELAKQNLVGPLEISIAVSKPSERVKQTAYLVNDSHKIQLIHHLLKDKPQLESIIIFSSSKKSISEIKRGLLRYGYPCEDISSDLDQQQREAVLNNFRSKKTRIIIATDVLSRGIDIKDINLVINYNVPSDGEDYVHRIGRTARADASGEAYTLVNEDEMSRMASVENLIGAEVQKEKIPSYIGESPEWDPKRKSYFSRSRTTGNRNDGKSKSGYKGKKPNNSAKPQGQRPYKKTNGNKD